VVDAEPIGRLGKLLVVLQITMPHSWGSMIQKRVWALLVIIWEKYQGFTKPKVDVRAPEKPRLEA